MDENKKLEYLRILENLSNQKDVHGAIANKMYTDLRRTYPWYFLMYSYKKKSDKVIEVHKQLILDKYKFSVEILIKSQLTQQDVDELELMNESLEKICKRIDSV